MPRKRNGSHSLGCGRNLAKQKCSVDSAARACSGISFPHDEQISPLLSFHPASYPPTGSRLWVGQQNISCDQLKTSQRPRNLDTRISSNSTGAIWLWELGGERLLPRHSARSVFLAASTYWYKSLRMKNLGAIFKIQEQSNSWEVCKSVEHQLETHGCLILTRASDSLQRRWHRPDNPNCDLRSLHIGSNEFACKQTEPPTFSAKITIQKSCKLFIDTRSLLYLKDVQHEEIHRLSNGKALINVHNHL